MVCCLTAQLARHCSVLLDMRRPPLYDGAAVTFPPSQFGSVHAGCTGGHRGGQRVTVRAQDRGNNPTKKGRWACTFAA
jgi:hypothetical protein